MIAQTPEDTNRISNSGYDAVTRRDCLRIAASTLAAELACTAVHAGVSLPGQGPGMPFRFRECYCPAHFGNAYEAMGPREMAAYLAEMKWMGFNRYSDWMVTTDVRTPYRSDPGWDLAHEQLDRKKKAFRSAQALGFDLNLIVTPNHVYLDQLRPEREAKTTKKIFGQLVCPSNPEARKVILGNFERWFDDLADSGLRFSALTAFAYDYGGCACERCRPWILTFARLMKEIHAIALRRHPQIEPWFCSWWWTEEEHAQFNAWAAKEAPGWLKGMTQHIEYGQTKPKDVAVPEGCRKLAFVHVGYGDQRGNEVYGRQGAVIAPHRLPETLRELRERGFEGFQAYSEGVFDDVNKTLLAALGSGRFSNTDAALRAYAERYFGSSPARAARWARWLTKWGDRTKVQFPAASREFARLTAGVKPTWRTEHWRIKTELEILDRAIGTPDEKQWTPEKLGLAEKYFATQERLYREVYRLGPVRHVINSRFLPPAWHESWSKYSATASAGGMVLPQQ